MWARFPISHGIDTPCTTNGCETYHRHLKHHIGNCHPNVFKFATILSERQELTYVKIQGVAAKRKPLTMKQREIKEACDMILSGSLNSYQFLHKLCFKFIPVITYFRTCTHTVQIRTNSCFLFSGF